MNKAKAQATKKNAELEAQRAAARRLGLSLDEYRARKKKPSLARQPRRRFAGEEQTANVHPTT